MAGRNYTEATKKALFTLSLGRCYEPNCPERVVQMADETPIVKVQIAHIRAAKKGGPRYDENMTDTERSSFPNLLLLCAFHHPLVDKKPTGDNYSVELLEGWKAQREGELTHDLNILTEDGLNEILGSTLEGVIGETKDELLAAIKEVEDITGESAQLLRTLVTETFNRPHLDADTVASLANSAHVLGNLPDYAPMLRESSRSLENLPDYAPMLNESSRDLRSLPDYVCMLRESAQALLHLPDYAPMIKESSQTLISLPDYAPMLNEAAQNIRKSAEQVERLLRAAENLNNASYISKLDTATNNLASASSDLASNIDEMENAARLALTATETRPPDRLTYVRNGMIAGAIIAALIVGGIWYLATHSIQ